MTTLGPYTVHQAADLLPLIQGEEFDDLVMDIKKNGLREPIILSHDRSILVDGRNRYRACEAAGVDFVYEVLPARYTEIMILDLVVSKNRRRHMSPGQRGMFGASLEPMYAAAIREEEEARKAAAVGDESSRLGNPTSTLTSGDRHESMSTERNKRNTNSESSTPKGRRADAEAARAAGASPTSVARSKFVKTHAPDLAAKVQSGELTLDAAYKQSKQRKRTEPKPEPAPKPSPVMLTLRTNDGTEVPYPQPQAKATFNETKGAGISWASWSWNPVTGCLHGCEYCYARAITTDERYKTAYPVGFTPLFHHERLDAPANTVIPAAHRDDTHMGCSDGACKVCAYRRVFVCSMADLYGRWVPGEWINQVHASMLARPWWEYLLLTKFPGRYVGLDLPPNAWVGTSVDEQKRVRLAEDAFRKIDGVKVKWLSLEPLREPLEFTDLSMFDWVVIGAQTETRQPDGLMPAFQPDWKWVIRITQQAVDAGCKVHWKPNLKNSPGMVWPDEYPNTQNNEGE